MNLFRFVTSYLVARPLSAFLHVLLLALGIAAIATLMLVNQQLEDRMQRDARGIDLVVGAKGSPLQLILSGIYHLDAPTGNIPLEEVQKLGANPLIKRVIPLALGDSFNGARIVGTSADYVTLYQAELMAGGRLWQKPLEAVLGSDVAASSGLKQGDKFSGSHGIVAGGEMHGDRPYTVTGILQPSGSVLDRLVLTSIESVWAVHEHHDAAADNANGKHVDEHDDDDEKREVTVLLVQYASPLAAVSLPRFINQQSALQAASPAFEIARLLRIVGVGAEALRAFGIVLLASAALSVFIALFQAMRERRYDMAIARVLGASRGKLFAAVLIEVLLIATAGAVLGLVLGHLMTSWIGMLLQQQNQIPVSGWTWLPSEWLLIVLAWGVGAAAALIPAIAAYRVDVARTLATA